MIIVIFNQTANPLSYLSGVITVPANGTTTVPSNYLYVIAKDSTLKSHCLAGNVWVGDGVQNYSSTDALDYLSTVVTSVGGAVIGLVGTAAPSYAILVGSKDQNGNIQAAAINTSGGISVSGDVASGSADAGYPIKIGSIYNSSLPTPSAGQRVDFQSNQFGEASFQFRNKFRNITGNSTTTIKSGSGRLHSIMINRNWTGGIIVLYDNTDGSGTKIATIDIGTPSGGLLSTTGTPGPVMLGPFGLEFSTGLTVVTSGSSNNDITILYQ